MTSNNQGVDPDKKSENHNMKMGMKLLSHFKKQKLIYLFLGFGLIATIPIFVYRLNFPGGLSDLQEIWGGFGDYITGTVGTILSALAVVLIYLTYSNQKKELLVTNEALKNQQAHDILFNLLERKDYLLNDIQITTENEINKKGIYALVEMNNDFKKESPNRQKWLNHCWGKYKRELQPYFNSFVTGVNYISALDMDNKKRPALFGLYFTNFGVDERKTINYLLEYNNKKSGNWINKIHECRDTVYEYRPSVLDSLNKRASEIAKEKENSDK